MIVRDIMKTQLITVGPDDLLGHAASLLRQHQLHHLPVVRIVKRDQRHDPLGSSQSIRLAFEGLLCVQDIDLAVAHQDCPSTDTPRSWQEQRVAAFMHPTPVSVVPTTPVGAAVQLHVTHRLSNLPVVEYDQEEQEAPPTLAGQLTRSDLLLAFARALGTFEPGTQVDIVLPLGDIAPLAQALSIAAELSIHVRMG